jgi:hypothetical protein
VAVGVAGFTIRGVTEEAGYVRISFDVGLLREVQITTVRLRLAGEGVFQILMGFGSIKLCHIIFSRLEL